MKRVHWLLADPYGYSILIYVGTWNQYRAHMLRHYAVDMGDQVNYGGEQSNIGNDTIEFSAIWLPRWDSKPWSIGTLSHELNHACFRLFKRIGTKVREGKKNEPFCYLQGQLLKRALETLNER